MSSSSSSSAGVGGFASQAIRSGHDATQSDSEDEEQSAYEMEEMGPPPGAMGPVEKTDIDVRMDRLPPGQSYNPSNGNPPAGMMPGVRPTGNGLPSANTGPKGVLADFEEAKRNLKNIRLREKIQRELAMDEYANTGLVAANANIPPRPEKPSNKEKGKAVNEDEEGSGSDEDDFLAKYKAARLAAMSSLQANLPEFGNFDRVDFAGMATAIKATNPLCFVLVHLYENDNVDCTRLNGCLETLAGRYKQVKFLRIRSVEAIPNYNPVGLPALVIYKGGEQLQSLVRVSDELPKSFVSIHVEALLKQKGVELTAPTGEQEFDEREKDDEDKRKKRVNRFQPKPVKDVDSDDD